jgi:hypothetical protein
MYYSVDDMFCGVLLQRFYGVKPCPKEMKCDVEVRFVGLLVLLAVSELMYYHGG